ncbi:PREDICTED: probable ATP-dependent RNA helicase DDX27 [Acropora digitifera]|uniref:probable ATP-dependent RNA helicase DDX27 n=1 Tax=Acropora digitifera TaxID=70779 RepID=UPI00077A3C3B|nr:PREDICTED: probable ATP-dependent RNA helicase DDX27 [Acropora digitifera]
MAALPFVGTLDSDEEVQQVDDETESEDEQTKPVKKAKKKKKGKSDVFQDGFNLFSGDTEDGYKDPWNFDAAINLLKKRQISTFQTSLQDKIAKRRDDKRKRKNAKATEEEEDQEDRDDASGKKEDEQLETEKEIESRENGANHTLNNNDEDNENNEGDDIGSEESSSEDDEKADKVTEKKKKFFQEPPPQVMHESFSTMNLSRPLLKAINDLGFIHPTPIQASTIPLALLGKDICACAATGTGKTAAYMLPILERLIYRPQNTTVTRVLVLAPTRELAIQVHSVSQALAKHTNIQICLATVPLLEECWLLGVLNGEVIDRMREKCQVEELANLSLNQPVRLFVDNNTDVAYNLRQEFVRIRNNRENDRLAIVTALCSRSFDEHCLIFMQTKHSAHRLRIILGLLGLNVEELHGNLTQLQRLEALRKFKEGQVDILVATDLASRGLDILGVKTVINTTLPPTLKQYIHRVGRTARAGRSGRSISLVGERERKLLKDIVKLAKTPVKSRIVPGEVIDKYKSKIEGLEKDVKAILKQEGEEKELRVSEIQMNKARNLIEHEKEIFSRPPRVWIQSKRDTKRKAENANEHAKKKSKNGNSKGKKTGNENEEERKAQKEMQFLTREAKRSRKNKKLRAFPEDKPNSKGKGLSKVILYMSRFKAFDKELTDTSKNALKAFRQSSRENDFRSAKKGSSGFKSKKRRVYNIYYYSNIYIIY